MLSVKQGNIKYYFLTRPGMEIRSPEPLAKTIQRSYASEVDTEILDLNGVRNNIFFFYITPRSTQTRLVVHVRVRSMDQIDLIKN